MLPSLAKVGYEEFHLDAGWETSFADDGWHFDPERFPNGFAPIRQWLREHGMSYYMWWGLNDITARKPAEVLRVIGETDAANLFFDRGVGEETVPALREIRKTYPGLSVMNHFAPSRSKNYPQVNLHLASELTQAYFAEEQYFQWSDVPPKTAQAGLRQAARRGRRPGNSIACLPGELGVPVQARLPARLAVGRV